MADRVLMNRERGESLRIASNEIRIASEALRAVSTELRETAVRVVAQSKAMVEECLRARVLRGER